MEKSERTNGTAPTVMTHDIFLDSTRTIADTDDLTETVHDLEEGKASTLKGKSSPDDFYGIEEGHSATSANTGSLTANAGVKFIDIHRNEGFNGLPGQRDSQILKQKQNNQSSANDDTSTSSTSTNNNNHMVYQRKVIFALLIFVVGAAASVAFLSTGIVTAKQDQSDQFSRMASEFVVKLQDAFQDYEMFGLWIHESCRSRGTAESARNPSENTLGICSRQDFKDIYEYIYSVGLDFKSVQFMPLVKRDQREAVEADARAYYEENYPQVGYRGIVGLFPKEGGGLTVLPQEEEDFYWPVHYVEPVEGNEQAIDLDLYTSPTQQKTIQNAISSWVPGVTDRLKLVQETEIDAYSIILHHPGVPLSTDTNETSPTSISLVVIRVPALLERTNIEAKDAASFYIYDATYADQDPVFLGAQAVDVPANGDLTHTNLPEISLAELQASIDTRFTVRQIALADRQWTIAVVSHPDTYEPDIVNVLVGGCLIIVASLILSTCFWAHMTRVTKVNKIKAKAAEEKAEIIVETARKQALAERQLNEYIAHEVRNPLSSAIAALSFVTAATNEPNPTEEDLSVMKEDLHIADASLQFINELLRNMLDMHRAANQQMNITMAPTDIMSDVLEPVASMLYLRGNKVEVITECPSNIVVISDRLRLKQIVSNLAMNATKFVQRGFIRLKCVVVETENGRQSVQLHLEDSGPGIPREKRSNLFAKFQESLDLLNQGTGIGLCLSKHLTNLMKGDLWLDESYDSGFEGCPGTRFILDLRVPPLREDYWNDEEELKPFGDRSRPQVALPNAPIEISNEQPMSTVNEPAAPQTTESSAGKKEGAENGESHNHLQKELPESLNVLFVDDDMILRKLFCRSLRRVAPGWKVQEASNGETAVHIVEDNLDKFDVIFMDQYMSSIEKQLLGTETVRLLRAKGVTCRICGLSANDAETPFMEAGADHFLFKPFPCETGPLKRTLLDVVSGASKIKVGFSA